MTAYQATSGKSEILTDLWAFEQPWDGSYRPGDPLPTTYLRQLEGAEDERWPAVWRTIASLESLDDPAE